MICADALTADIFLTVYKSSRHTVQDEEVTGFGKVFSNFRKFFFVHADSFLKTGSDIQGRNQFSKFLMDLQGEMRQAFVLSAPQASP